MRVELFEIDIIVRDPRACLLSLLFIIWRHNKTVTGKPDTVGSKFLLFKSPSLQYFCYNDLNEHSTFLSRRERIDHRSECSTFSMVQLCLRTLTLAHLIRRAACENQTQLDPHWLLFSPRTWLCDFSICSSSTESCLLESRSYMVSTYESQFFSCL